MTDGVEILLVEDNPNDLKLTLHAFKQHNLANQIQVARDGEEALEFLFCTGRYAGRAKGVVRIRGNAAGEVQEIALDIDPDAAASAHPGCSRDLPCV